MIEGNHAVNVRAVTVGQGTKITNFLQIVQVSIQSGSNRLITDVFSIMDQRYRTSIKFLRIT